MTTEVTRAYVLDVTELDLRRAERDLEGARSAAEEPLKTLAVRSLARVHASFRDSRVLLDADRSTATAADQQAYAQALAYDCVDGAITEATMAIPPVVLDEAAVDVLLTDIPCYTELIMEDRFAGATNG